MIEISARLVARGDGEMSCGFAVAEAANLREDEPHPMRLLATRAKLGDRVFKRRGLRGDKALEMERIIHFESIREVDRDAESQSLASIDPRRGNGRGNVPIHGTSLGGRRGRTGRGGV